MIPKANFGNGRTACTHSHPVMAHKASQGFAACTPRGRAILFVFFFFRARDFPRNHSS